MRLRVAIVAIGVGLAWPGVALGAGGPVLPVQGAGNGISVSGSPYQYVALPAGRSTVVQQLKRTGPVQSSIRVPGQYGIPGVGYNGQTRACRPTAARWCSPTSRATARRERRG
jgi:hypothetical protein